MSKFELPLEQRVQELIDDAEILKNRLLSEYGVSEFSDLPVEVKSQFDLLMSAGGWDVVPVEGRYHD